MCKMKITVTEESIVNIEVHSRTFKFTEGNKNVPECSCPLIGVCSSMPDPRNLNNVHMDFMDFCGTLGTVDKLVELCERKGIDPDSLVVYSNTLINK